MTNCSGVYKDSGVEWIGKIPEDWNLTKIKYCCSVYTGNSISDDEKDNYTNEENAIPYVATKDIDADTNTINYDNGLYIPIDSSNFKIAPQNSIILCVEGGSAGKKIAYTNRDICFVNKLCCFNAESDYSSKYIFYSLQCSSFLTEFNLSMSGLIGGVSSKQLKNIFLSFPSYKGQQVIANYLDKKCWEIDKVVETEKAVIEKLKEYKQSIITEAVTKGLDKSVPLKDSGIEWIGKIPAHWEVTKLKNISLLITDGAHISPETDNGVYDFVSTVDVKQDKIDFVHCLKTSTGSYNQLVKNNCNPQNGDILISKDGTVGKTVIIDYKRDFVVASSLVIIRLLDEYNKYFINYVLKSSIVQEQLNLFMNGAGLKRVSVENNKKLNITIPPIEEQQQIADYLDKKCSEIDKAISDKEKVIEKFTEYKKSLIYECVTGKKEIQ